ncbi:MAG: hypothetical protein HQ525_05410 [Anaerolineae bacterium]|nr:hypothetical protein [Anaerolineae bacterium]
MKVSIWKVVLFLGLIALLVGGGAMLYRAGFSQGVMSDMTFPEGGFEQMMPYRGYGYGYGHMGFFSLGRMLFTGFFFLMIFGLFFRLFMGRRFGPPWAYRMHREGKGGSWDHHDHPYRSKKHPEGDDAVEEEKPEK